MERAYFVHLAFLYLWQPLAKSSLFYERFDIGVFGHFLKIISQSYIKVDDELKLIYMYQYMYQHILCFITLIALN